MMIKEVNILHDYIEFVEEKKSIFGIKNHISKINVESIDKIEKLMSDKELIGIVLWNKNDVLYAIGFKNYKDNLKEVYDKIFSTIKNSIKIIETEL